MRLIVLCAIAFASPLLAQGPVPNPEAPRADPAAQLAAANGRLAYRPDANGVAGVQKQLVDSAGVAPGAKARANDLRRQAYVAMTEGRQGDSSKPSPPPAQPD